MSTSAQSTFIIAMQMHPVQTWREALHVPAILDTVEMEHIVKVSHFLTIVIILTLYLMHIKLCMRMYYFASIIIRYEITD